MLEAWLAQLPRDSVSDRARVRRLDYAGNGGARPAAASPVRQNRKVFSRPWKCKAPCATGRPVSCTRGWRIYTVPPRSKRLAIAEAAFAVLLRRLACRTGDTCTTPVSALQHF